MRPASASLARTRLHIGDVVASRRPMELETTLGSCVAACLYDPEAGVGGMNHFLLPTGLEDGYASSQFGVHAMDLLIGALQKHGAQRSRLKGKLFGGAHLLSGPGRSDGVAAQNVRFIEDFMAEEGIPIVSSDLGGDRARIVRFTTSCARARVRRLESGLFAPIRSRESAYATSRAESGEHTTIELYGDLPWPAQSVS